MINKNKTVSFRLTKKEHADILSRIPVGDNGKPIMKFSTFARGAVFDKRLVAVDREVEQYKVYTAAKIGNNLNQIAKRLNEDNLAGKIEPSTYDDVLDNLEKVYEKLNTLLAPVA
ncbi:MAG: MobC family plasmid mobilization relaxosome protein [Lentisphaerae bacterium]|nr:MobC family plasmid mobilization relaxosome protein [Lentisphaerota bacterium]